MWYVEPACCGTNCTCPQLCCKLCCCHCLLLLLLQGSKMSDQATVHLDRFMRELELKQKAKQVEKGSEDEVS